MASLAISIAASSLSRVAGAQLIHTRHDHGLNDGNQPWILLHGRFGMNFRDPGELAIDARACCRKRGICSSRAAALSSRGFQWRKVACHQSVDRTTRNIDVDQRIPGPFLQYVPATRWRIRFRCSLTPHRPAWRATAGPDRSLPGRRDIAGINRVVSGVPLAST